MSDKHQLLARIFSTSHFQKACFIGWIIRKSKVTVLIELNQKLSVFLKNKNKNKTKEVFLMLFGSSFLGIHQISGAHCIQSSSSNKNRSLERHMFTIKLPPLPPYRLYVVAVKKSAKKVMLPRCLELWEGCYLSCTSLL